MIVKMKKATILLDKRHRDEALKKLRKLGVLHVKSIQNPVSEDIHSIEAKIENLNRALQIIISEPENLLEINVEDAGSCVDQILALNQEKSLLQHELDELLQTHQWFEKWGAISLTTLKILKEKGIFIRFYIADKNALKDIPKDKIIHIAHQEQHTVYLALFSQDAEDRLDLREVQPPQLDIAYIETRINEIEIELTRIDGEIKELSRYRDSLVNYRAYLEKQLEINRVKFGMGESGEITYLQGFCPAETVKELKKLAESEGWGYLIDEPDEPAEVPTLIKNPKWIEIIKPLFSFMGTLPGYDEQDVSLVFLVFFSIFYAIIVGDAGYGLIFLLATLYFDLKKKNGPREFFRLMYLVSFTTIIWGLVTGTWFGSEKIAQLPFLNMFIIEKISSFNPESNTFVMQLTFVIGTVHLTIGHLMTAFRKMNSLTALAEIGWVFILWAVYFVANNIVLGAEMAAATMPLFITGVSLVLVFANFQKNVIKGILATLGNLPLDVISSFSDVVSYIRLFAVGLATVIVATNFNNMAIGSGINSIFSGIIAAIILFLGHSINLALCGMSILVHGVRLNMLEFSGHVGVQWTGKPYQPFKE